MVFDFIFDAIFSASSVEMRAVVNAARNSFTKLVDKLCRQFEGVSPHPGIGGRDRNSLVRVIGRGLSKICVGKSVDQKGQIVPAQVCGVQFICFSKITNIKDQYFFLSWFKNTLKYCYKNQFKIMKWIIGFYMYIQSNFYVLWIGNYQQRF